MRDQFRPGAFRRRSPERLRGPAWLRNVGEGVKKEQASKIVLYDMDRGFAGLGRAVLDPTSIVMDLQRTPDADSGPLTTMDVLACLRGELEEFREVIGPQPEGGPSHGGADRRTGLPAGRIAEELRQPCAGGCGTALPSAPATHTMTARRSRAWELVLTGTGQARVLAHPTRRHSTAHWQDGRRNGGTSPQPRPHRSAPSPPPGSRCAHSNSSDVLSTALVTTCFPFLAPARRAPARDRQPTRPQIRRPSPGGRPSLAKTLPMCFPPRCSKASAVGRLRSWNGLRPGVHVHVVVDNLVIRPPARRPVRAFLHSGSCRRRGAPRAQPDARETCVVAQVATGAAQRVAD